MPARSPSAGRTTTTPTSRPRGTARRATRPRSTYRIQVVTDPSFSARSSTPRTSTRRPTRRSTGSTPTAPTTGASRPSTQRQLGLTLAPRWPASPRPARQSCRARRWVAPWCPGRPRCGGTPRRSPRRTRSRSTRTTTRPSARPTGSSPATVRTTSVAPTDPIPASNTPYLWRVRRADSVRQPGPVVGDRVVHLVRHGAEPAHAQGGSRRSAARPRTSSGPRCRVRRGTC